jgi:hypothetical protein
MVDVGVRAHIVGGVALLQPLLESLLEPLLDTTSATTTSATPDRHDVCQWEVPVEDALSYSQEADRGDDPHSRHAASSHA